MEEMEIKGYQFDGDPDGLNFIKKLSAEEMQTLVNAVSDRGKANLQDGRGGHLEITKSSGGVFMVSKVKGGSSWWF